MLLGVYVSHREAEFSPGLFEAQRPFLPGHSFCIFDRQTIAHIFSGDDTDLTVMNPIVPRQQRSEYSRRKPPRVYRGDVSQAKMIHSH